MTQPDKTQPSSNDRESYPRLSPAAAERADDQLAAGNQDRSERCREALMAVEGGSAEQVSNRSAELDALTRRRTGDEHGDDDKLDEALDDKALEDGVEAAHETAQIVHALTPHNF